MIKPSFKPEFVWGMIKTLTPPIKAALFDKHNMSMVIIRRVAFFQIYPRVVSTFKMLTAQTMTNVVVSWLFSTSSMARTAFVPAQ